MADRRMASKHGWRDKAMCVGEPSHIFFPESAHSDRVWDAARAVCARCPVHVQCLEFALTYEDLEDRWGMYGGRTPYERTMIRERRRKYWNG